MNANMILAHPERETTLTATPMEMLAVAVSQGADVDRLAKLMELQERWEANEARKAFSAAFSAFKAEAITIVKNVAVSDGPLKGKRYADLFGVVSAITPLLSKHGLSHAWNLTKDEPQWMEVTCTIRHEKGHTESVSMGAAPDTGPGRNAIQSRGSAKTYLERYTLLAATGLAAGEGDDDGAAAGGVDPSTREEWCMAIREADSLDTLKRVFGSAYRQAQEANDRAAMQAYMGAKEARKKEL